MYRSARVALITSLFLLLVCACEGGTSGSMRNASQTCRNLGGYGDCEGRIGRLSGSVSLDVEDEGIGPGDLVRVDMTVSLEEGDLRVFIQGPEGTSTQVEVDSSSPATLSGLTEGEFDGFGISLQSLGEYAAGVDYSLRYYLE